MCQDCDLDDYDDSPEPPEGYYDSPLSLRERIGRRIRDRLWSWWHRNDPPFSDEPPF